MSLTAFKKKSIIQYGTKRSGRTPGGQWPAHMGEPFATSYGPVGFSVEGTHRNVGYVGKTYQMSKQGTPYRGQYPCWTSGGRASRTPTGSNYAIHNPVLNVREVEVLGTQAQYVKPSVLSTRGMLHKKYKWAYYGQYPHYWVQPVYSGNQTDSASQGVYLQTLSAAADTVLDVNQNVHNKYNTYIKQGGPTLCHTTAARFKYNDMASNGPYTKTLYRPIDSSQQTLRIQRPCANPVGPQKPFPFAVNSGSNLGTGGIGGISGGNSGVCTLTRPEYLTPPAWYWTDNRTLTTPPSNTA